MVEYNNWLVNIRNIIEKYWLPALIKKDQDRLIVIEGKEGSSKSTLALHIAHYFMEAQGQKFDIKNIHYDIHSLINTMKNSKPGDVQIIDEGALMGFSRDAMSKGVKLLIRWLSTCRSKNNLILICVPNIKLLDRYLREHRLAGVLRVTIRGRCDIYDSTLWKKAQYKEKYSKKMKIKRSSIVDSYPKFQTVWGNDLWQAYLDHKDSKLGATTVKPKKELTDLQKTIIVLRNRGNSYRKIAEVLKVTYPTVYESYKNATS